MRHVPNIFCSSRVVLAVPVVVLILINEPWTFLVATILFILGTVTDILDGYSARRLGLVSPFGAFFDLTADKVFIPGILIALIQVDIVPAWIVIIIIARDSIIAGVRSMALAKNRVIPAGKLGKQKTFITSIAIGELLMAEGLGAFQPSLFQLTLVFNNQMLQAREILLLSGDILLLIAMFWTVVSGAHYILGALPLLHKEGESAGFKA